MLAGDFDDVAVDVELVDLFRFAVEEADDFGQLIFAGFRIAGPDEVADGYLFDPFGTLVRLDQGARLEAVAAAIASTALDLGGLDRFVATGAAGTVVRARAELDGAVFRAARGAAAAVDVVQVLGGAADVVGFAQIARDARQGARLGRVGELHTLGRQTGRRIPRKGHRRHEQPESRRETAAAWVENC